MNKTLTLLLSIFLVYSVEAQTPTCVIDSTILQTGALISPLPWTDSTMQYNLNAACIDQPYNQSLTINVPPIFTFESINLPITNLSIATTGAISNLPTGLTYNCDPPNCTFLPGQLGCILLYGTPTSANMAPDTFDLDIWSVLNSIIPIPLRFPISGSHFYLTLKGPGCLVGNKDISNQLIGLKNAPNPFTNETFITAESLVAGDFQFEVFDLLGKRIYLKKIRLEIGHNEFAFDASELSNGAHFYTLSNNDGKAVRQMIVAR